MKLNLLLQDITPLRIVGSTDVEISEVKNNSRKLNAGALFVAQAGTKVDGHTFIEDCLQQGAAAIVMDNPAYMPAESETGVCFVLVKNSNTALGLIANTWYDKPSEKLTLVGVTGTNGKTTTATLLYELFQELGHKAGLISTIVNYIDRESVRALQTTPNALVINSLLARMVEAGCEYAFMEVSSHAIDQDRIAGLRYAGALFTNLTRDHLDYHKTFEHYRDTKKRLFDTLPREAFAITNIDDKNGLVMTQNCQAPVHTYSTQAMADYRGKLLEQSLEGMLLHITDSKAAIDTDISVKLIGSFNVANLLLVYGAAVCLGMDAMEVLRVLSTLKPVNGRFETMQTPYGWTAVIDYAHTPDALENVLRTIRDIMPAKSVEWHEPRIITMVGCGGDRDKGKRPIMAKIASELSDVVVFTSDNPRYEDPRRIILDMVEGLGRDQGKIILIEEERREGIYRACSLARKGDVVLFAGRGHEKYQTIYGVKYPFDDHEEIKNFIHDQDTYGFYY